MIPVELNDDLYIRFRDMLYQRVGLNYPERKRSDLAYAVGQALHAMAYTDLQRFYQEAEAGGLAWETLLSHATIGETYFFRNSAQFTALREQIVPDILRRRGTLGHVRIWSAGCSSGEEPYSIAMTLKDVLPDHASLHTSILATDLNLEFLARAQSGLYGTWSFRETSEHVRDRYFKPEGNRWRLNDDIRRMVRFARLNLVEDAYPAIMNGTCALDIIFCRNVTIYFDTATTRAIVERFYKALVPGGWLIVGHAEPQSGVYDQFEVHNFVNTVVYRKPPNAPLFAFDPQNGTFSAGQKPLLTPSASVAVKPPQITASPAFSISNGLPAQAPVKVALRRHETTMIEPDRPSTAICESPKEEPIKLVQLGRACANRGEWDAAEAHCRHALTLDPLCRAGHYLLAQIFEHHEKLDEALAEYRRSVYLDPGFVPGTIGMANVWRQLSRPEEASRNYRNALKQLARIAPETSFDDADGVTPRDLQIYVTQQLESLTTIV
jgi:chemotaxis protein methyltransferase CheR